MLRPNKELQKLLKLIAVYCLVPFFVGLFGISHIHLVGKIVFFAVILFIILGIDDEYRDKGLKDKSPYKFYMAGWASCLVGNLLAVMLFL